MESDGEKDVKLEIGGENDVKLEIGGENQVKLEIGGENDEQEEDILECKLELEDDDDGDFDDQEINLADIGNLEENKGKWAKQSVQEVFFNF